MEKRGYWNYEKCLKAAKKYKDYKAFYRNESSAFRFILKNGLLEKLLKDAGFQRVYKVKGHWNFENCLKAAKKVESLQEFKDLHSSAAQAAYQNKWIEEIVELAGLSRLESWSLESCKKEARKYKTKADFRAGSPKAYGACVRRGWIKKISSHFEVRGHLYKRMLYAFEYSDKSVYVGLTCDYDRRFAQHMSENKLLIDKNKKFKQKFIKFNKAYPSEIAAKKEQSLIKKYRKNGWTILNKTAGGELGTPTKFWTKEACAKEALLYDTKLAFKLGSPGALGAAYKMGIMADISKHMKSIFPLKGKNHGSYKWTDEMLIEEANKYKTKIDFMNACNSAYQTLIRRKLTSFCDLWKPTE